LSCALRTVLASAAMIPIPFGCLSICEQYYLDTGPARGHNLRITRDIQPEDGVRKNDFVSES
jgi:hypothetical protein